MVEFEVEGGVRVRIVMEGQEVIDDWERQLGDTTAADKHRHLYATS